MIVPVGDVEDSQIEALKQSLKAVFAQEVTKGNGMALPKESWRGDRGQYLASSILSVLSLPKSGDRILGVVDVDIFAPELNFVFGQANVSGRRALISLKRLKQEFYGLPSDESLFRQRTLKEAVHELGHTYDLGHCPDRICVMHFSNCLADTDFKGWKFCSVCRRKLGALAYG